MFFPGRNPCSAEKVSSFARVVVGVVIHQNSGRKTFGELSSAGLQVVEGYEELLKDDFTQVSASTATTVAEFTRDARQRGISMG